MQKMPLMVCPHDTAKRPERWYEFSVYLSHALDRVVSFSQSVDFQDFHENMPQSALIYANPQDAVGLNRDRGFLPLARASQLYDEVVVIANVEVPEAAISSLHQQAVASVLGMLVTQIGLRHVAELGASPQQIVDQRSWLHVLKAVYKKEVDFGFLYKDFYDGLNALSKSSVQILGHSDSRQAYHVLMLHPAYAEWRARLCEVLEDMPQQARGRALLEDLRVGHWVRVEQPEMQQLQALSHTEH